MRISVTKFIVCALAVSASPGAHAQPGPAAGQMVNQTPEQTYVCIKKWGIARNEGFCGMASEKDADNISIRVMRIDRTVWRTRGTPCSAGLNLKDFIPGIIIVVPKTCL